MERKLMVSAGIISRHFVLAAGGTGGHMMPAYALAEELIRRGHHVALITDERGVRFYPAHAGAAPALSSTRPPTEYTIGGPGGGEGRHRLAKTDTRIPGLSDDAEIHILPVGRIAGGPIGWIKAVWNIMMGRRMARRLYRSFRPAAVIGFGGYPAFPALIAARSMGIPTAIHEQNAVLGRVNRLLAGGVDAIATAYPEVERLKAAYRGKACLVGNPVRESVLALRDEPFPALKKNDALHVLVTGGSQGATILSDVVPKALSMLPEEYRRRLKVTQQCRPDDIEEVRARYAGYKIPADLATYLPDIPARLAASHLVIARAGASTIAELTVAGRPAIFIPLPIATDDHQTANVREMVEAGAARTIPQSQFTPAELVRQMLHIGLDPEALASAAAYARAIGHPDATSDLADLVERIGHTPAADPLLVSNSRAATVPNGAFA
jgi:UDP-N-acetylglucosamine--N-acetylmuramyl-(pentapeptide) pyrophosphoryl-undecaprenol N-acetylglucosamine transferase